MPSGKPSELTQCMAEAYAIHDMAIWTSPFVTRPIGQGHRFIAESHGGCLAIHGFPEGSTHVTAGTGLILLPVPWRWNESAETIGPKRDCWNQRVGGIALEEESERWKWSSKEMSSRLERSWLGKDRMGAPDAAGTGKTPKSRKQLERQNSGPA